MLACYGLQVRSMQMRLLTNQLTKFERGLIKHNTMLLRGAILPAGAYRPASPPPGNAVSMIEGSMASPQHQGGGRLPPRSSIKGSK